MKDNRSLEQKIREVHEAVLEAAFERNTNIRRKVANVGRPTDNVKDDSSKLAKQGEIKTKVIDEDAVAGVSTKDSAKEQPESGKKKKENNRDLLEPGKIQGGKTEVDLTPTTDDRDDEGKKIDDKSKKATKAANAQAGVKEETMDNKFKFGLPADLIKTVAEAMGKCTKCGKKPCMCEPMEEELIGKQKKLDKNHNGKLDKQDFKMLRGKKTMEEEIDPGFSEAELAHIMSIINEDSKDPYTSKSGKHIDSHMTDHEEGHPDGKPDHKIGLRNGDSVHVHYVKGENGKTKHTVMSHHGDYTSGSYSVPGKAHPKHIESSWNRATKPEHDDDY